MGTQSERNTDWDHEPPTMSNALWLVAAKPVYLPIDNARLKAMGAALKTSTEKARTVLVSL